MLQIFKSWSLHRQYQILTLIFLLVIINGCSTNTDPSKQLNTAGVYSSKDLSNLQINELNSNNNYIYAGTESGLYRLNRHSDGTNWQLMGLPEKNILDFVVWNNQKLLVGTSIDSSKDTSIYFTNTASKSWQPYQNGFGTAEQNNHLFVIEKHPDNSQKLFARGDFNVAVSSDSGQSWKNIYGNWDGFGGGYFLTISQFNPQVIWGGGVNANFQPHLFKSSDGGSSWKDIRIIENVETTIHDLIIHPQKTTHILAGTAGGFASANLIRKSTDGGETWKTVLEGINTRTFTHSADNPEWVYASGRNTDGSLFFVASGDFGESWETIEWDDSPAGVQINDMVSVMEDGQEVLYFGTNQGVFSYTFSD